MRVNEKVNLPIITYHSIDGSGSVISTAPDVFRSQMKRLSEDGYKAVSLGQLSGNLVENASVSDGKTIALTFDDGFENFATEAFPVLEELGFTATVFLVTDFCGGYNDWENNPEDLPRSRLMSWQQVEELSGKGIEFGVHTRTHADLTKLTGEEIESEVVESKAKIEEVLGKEVDFFAYPYGKHNPAVKEIVEKNYKGACSTNLGKVNRNSDQYLLERIDSYYLKNQRVFSALSTKYFDRYMQLRHAMRVCKALILQN